MFMKSYKTFVAIRAKKIQKFQEKKRKLYFIKLKLIGRIDY